MANFNLLDSFIERAKGSGKRIVLPDGNDVRAIKAASIAAQLKLAKIIILGDENEIAPKINKKLLNEIAIINPARENPLSVVYANALYELRKHKGMTIENAKFEITKPSVFASLMVKLGDADGVVGGISMPTAELIRPAFQIVKTAPGADKVSSFMIMKMPNGTNFGSRGVMFFADCGVIPEPTSEDLATIAIETANSAKNLCGITPRVALLSYSTHSSGGETESVSKVKNALKIVKEKCPELIIDGEVQADAAIVPEVSASKCLDNNVLGGRANVLVFPNLDSANIGYKLVQRIAGVEAVGPILQGLASPVNDLSRGASVNEMVRAIAITALQSKK